jgi:hypothetical protein
MMARTSRKEHTESYAFHLQRVGLHNTSTQHTHTHTSQPLTISPFCVAAAMRLAGGETAAHAARSGARAHNPRMTLITRRPPRPPCTNTRLAACVHQFRSCSRPSLSYGHSPQHHFPSFYHFDSHPHIGCGQVGQARPASGYSVLFSR